MPSHLKIAFLCAATALCVASAPKAARLEHFKELPETCIIANSAKPVLTSMEDNERIKQGICISLLPKGWSYSKATGTIEKSEFYEIETFLITINRIKEIVEDLKFGGSIKSRAIGKWSISLNIGIEKRNAILFRSVIMGEQYVPFTKLISGVLLSPRVDANVKLHF
jgi:hypothetical protein